MRAGTSVARKELHGCRRKLAPRPRPSSSRTTACTQARPAAPPRAGRSLTRCCRSSRNKTSCRTTTSAGRPALRDLAEPFGLADLEIARIGLAARLHDVGKVASRKRSSTSRPLERRAGLHRRHSEIGERIVAAAPALAGARPRPLQPRALRRCGYPDGARATNPDGCTDHRRLRRLPRDDLPSGPTVGPIGFRCRARRLKRLAGTQFDTNVVEAFCRLTAPEQPSAEQSQAMAAAR